MSSQVDTQEQDAMDARWWETLQEQVRAAGRAAAEVFVDEFHRPCRAENGDWDAEAWAIDSSGGGRLYPAICEWADEHPDDDATESSLRELYLDTLYTESARLAEAT